MQDLYLFKKYLKDISKHPLITREQEIEFAGRIRQGDKEALQQLVNSNLKLVVKISLEFYKNTISLMDIIQNGNIGLMKAARKFDPDKGVKFSTYAAYWIKQSILRGFIKPSHNINISYRKDAINKKIRNFVLQRSEKDGKFPKIEEIVDELHVARRDAVDVLYYMSNVEYSLNDVVFEDGDEYIDNIADDSFNPEKIVERVLLEEAVSDAVDSFSVREKEIIRKRYGFDDEHKETLQNLGEKYAITAEAARQIEKRVLTAMRHRYPNLSSFYYTY